jgi:hypothetical protein
MRNELKILFTGLLLTFFAVNHAQVNFVASYIVTNQFDTIPGFIDFRSNKGLAKEIVFKAFGKEDIAIYKPFEIAGFSLDYRSRYESKRIAIDSTEMDVFLELLIYARVSLWSYHDKEDDYFFAEKDPGILLMIPDEKKEVLLHTYRVESRTQSFAGFLIALFPDDRQIHKRIEQSLYLETSFVDLFKEYHNNTCKDWDCVVYAKAKEKILTSFIIGTGMVFIQPVLIQKNLMDAQRGITGKAMPSISFGINTSLPGVNDNTSITTMLSMSKFDIQAYIYYTQASNDHYFDFYSEGYSLRFLTTLNLSWPGRIISPKISIGFETNTYLKQEYGVTRFYTAFYPGYEEVQLWLEEPVPIVKNMLGPCIAAGVDIKTGIRIKPFVNARYAFMLPLYLYPTYDNDIFYRLHFLAINTGVYF